MGVDALLGMEVAYMAKTHKDRARKANKELERLRKRMRKFRKGSDNPKHADAAAVWKNLGKQSVKSSCCGKPLHKLCKSCPQRVLTDIRKAG
ncbi:MAG: hypothetical protein EA401_14885 [Planctomycetota bacterium]|nr:MAG: hypothetical protein EA401_14885 [Planctomycetota bacterium]